MVGSLGSMVSKQTQQRSALFFPAGPLVWSIRVGAFSDDADDSDDSDDSAGDDEGAGDAAADEDILR